MTQYLQSSPLESNRFNLNAAKLEIYKNNYVLSNIVKELDESPYDLIISKIKTENFELVHLLEEKGFKLMDTQLQFKLDLKRKKELIESSYHELIDLIKIEKFSIRKPVIEDLTVINELIDQCFSNYKSHYHQNRLINKDKDYTKEIYIDWFTSGMNKEINIGNSVVIDEAKNKIVGFAFSSFSDENKTILNGNLSCVDSSYRSKNLYSAMIMHGSFQAMLNNVLYCTTATQITNKTVFKQLLKLGLEYDESFYIFHKTKLGDK